MLWPGVDQHDSATMEHTVRSASDVDHEGGVPRMVTETFPFPTLEVQSARGSVPDVELSAQGESAVTNYLRSSGSNNVSRMFTASFPAVRRIKPYVVCKHTHAHAEGLLFLMVKFIQY